MKIFSILCIAMMLSHFLFAQPANNTCGTAVTLAYSGACVMGTNTSANVVADGIAAEPACWAGGATDWNESVWYSVTLPAGQTTLAVSVLAGTLSYGNTGMLIYSGTCGTLTQLACVLGVGVVSATGLIAGTTYFIMLDGVSGNDGDFCISAGPAPTNDTRCAATSLTVGAVCINGSNVGSTDSGDPDPSCVTGPANIENSVWYSFLATDDSISVNFGDGTLGTSLISAVYSSSTGACGGVFTEIGCTNTGSEIDLTGLVIGRTYFVQVDGKTTIVGTFCISTHETPPPPPPIGTCANPRDLYLARDCNNISGFKYDEQNNLLSTSSTGRDAGASMAGTQYLNFVEQSCGSTDVGQQGYWVRFTATTTSINVANYGGSGYDYSVFTGMPTNSTCTAGLTPAGCLTVTAGDLTGNTMATTTGTTYYMLITPSLTGNATNAFACLTASTNFVPPNDNCSNAVQINFGEGYNLTTSNATVDINNTLCSGTTENNIWVSYAATYTGTAFVFLQDQDCACANGTQMSIYNASAGCPNNSSTCSITLNPNNDNDFSGQFSVVNGSTYYIQLDGYAGCGCSFNLCINSFNNADCSLLLLPVSLSNSTAECINESEVLISWETQSELNNSYFELQRSVEGIEFENLKTIAAIGNSTNSIYYSFTDENPIQGFAYYRIKQVDLDGQTFYSKIMSVNCGNNKEAFSFYPNPNNGTFTINSLKSGKLSVFNTIGSRVAYQNIAEGNLNIDLSHLADGVYYLQLESDFSSSVKKVIINK